MEIERKLLHDTKKPIHTMITLLDLLIGGDEKNPDLIKYMEKTLKIGQGLLIKYNKQDEFQMKLVITFEEAYKVIEEILQTFSSNKEYKIKLNDWRNNLMNYSQKVEELTKKGPL